MEFFPPLSYYPWFLCPAEEQQLIRTKVLIIRPLSEFSVPVSPGWKSRLLACVRIFCFCSILQLPVGDFQIQANKTLHNSVCSPYSNVCGFMVILLGMSPPSSQFVGIFSSKHSFIWECHTQVLYPTGKDYHTHQNLQGFSLRAVCLVWSQFLVMCLGGALNMVCKLYIENNFRFRKLL